MNATDYDKLEDALYLPNVMVKASEQWGAQYDKDEKSLAKLIRLEATIERDMRKYFRGLGERANMFIDWYGYASRLRSITKIVKAADDFNVDVLILDDALAGEDDLLMRVLYDPLALAAALGAQSSEVIYARPIGLSPTSASIQRTAREQIAELVGKRIDQNGNIIDNPRAEYHISNKTRKDIRESISTSLALGEEQDDALDRMRKVIADPRRAEMIAQTETVNAYQRGVLSFGRESGAVAKRAESYNLADICGVNMQAGLIPINKAYPSGQQSPAFHPRCRCAQVLIFPEDDEANDL